MFQGMEYVYEVYKQKSFSKAAAKLYISQPSLSANVKRIEKKVGYPLFDRSTKPLELTECGKQYIHAVHQIMTATTEFETFINDFGELRTGSLHFGGSNFFSSWGLPPLLARFSAKYPDLEISLVEAKSRELVKLLQDSQIDFILDNKELDLKVFDRPQVGRCPKISPSTWDCETIKFLRRPFRTDPSGRNNIRPWISLCSKRSLSSCSIPSTIPETAPGSSARNTDLNLALHWNWISSSPPTTWPDPAWELPSPENS